MPPTTTITVFGQTILKEMAISGAIYLLRLVQLTTLSISCFGACYLVWMHNHHYCAYYSCGIGSDGELASVPLGEAVFVTCCVLACLEWIYCTSSALVRYSQGKRADSVTQLFCTWTTVLLLTIGLGMFASIRQVRRTWPLCGREGVYMFSSYYPVEQNMCIVTQSTVTTGLINWIASCLLAVLATREVRMEFGMGRIKLPLLVGGDGNNGGETESVVESGIMTRGEDVQVGISAMGIET